MRFDKEGIKFTSWRAFHLFVLGVMVFMMTTPFLVAWWIRAAFGID